MTEPAYLKKHSWWFLEDETLDWKSVNAILLSLKGDKKKCFFFLDIY